MSTMTLTLDARHMEALEALAAEQDMSKTQVMRQALRLYQMVHLRAKAGEQLAFTKDGKVVPMIVPSMLPLAAEAMTRDAIEQHVAEEVAREREELLDLVDSYAKDNADLKDAIRARAEKGTK